MSAIVGLAINGKVYMAADSLGSSDVQKIIYSRNKIFLKDNFLFGFGGSYRFGDILEHTFDIPNRDDNITDLQFLVRKFIPELQKCLETNRYINDKNIVQCESFLLGHNGCLYNIQADFSIVRSVNNYDAIGSGFVSCLGALNILTKLDISPKKIVKKAIKVAKKDNPFVGGKINILTL